MTLQRETIQVRTSAPGAKAAAQDLRQVRQGVTGLGQSAVGIMPALGGAGLLTGLLGGSLIGLASATGAASNAGIRLTSILEDMIESLLSPLQPALDWFESLDEKMQAAIIGGTALAGVFRNKIPGALRAMKGPLGVIGLITAGFAAAYTQSDDFKGLVDGALKGALEGLRSLTADLKSDWEAIAGFWNSLDKPKWLDESVKGAFSSQDLPSTPSEFGAAFGKGVVEGNLAAVTYRWLRDMFRGETSIMDSIFPKSYIFPRGTTMEQFNDPAYRKQYEVNNPLLWMGGTNIRPRDAAPQGNTIINHQYFGANMSAVEDAARAAQNDSGERMAQEGFN